MSEEICALTYKDALARIDEIVEQIDDNDHDVDALAPLVEEAAALLAHCRTRLEHTRLRVDAALEDILRTSGAPSDDDA